MRRESTGGSTAAGASTRSSARRPDRTTIWISLCDVHISSGSGSRRRRRLGPERSIQSASGHARSLASARPFTDPATVPRCHHPCMAARALRSTQLDELHRAVLAIGGDLDLDRTLRRILRAAAKLVGARYAALGIQSADGGFGTFITIGISARQQELIGSLPRLHGLLGTILKKGAPVRLADIRRHPDFSYYPANHPQLREFLGVPIVHRGEGLGELYSSGTAARRFSPDDQRMVEMLAAHAGVAIATARLAGRERELAALQERDRLSRRVQEAVSSALVDIIAEARAGADRAADPAAARRTLGSLEATAAAALGEVRQLTPREREVLRLMVEGLANKEIAHRLDLSERTVKTHVSSVLGKLGVADRTQAAVLAVKSGLLD